MKCHGKCYLKKQLKKAEPKESQPEAPVIQEVEIDQYVQDIRTNSSFEVATERQIHPENSSRELDGFRSSIWNPPWG